MVKIYEGFSFYEILIIVGIMIAFAVVLVPASYRESHVAEIKSFSQNLYSNMVSQQLSALSGKSNSNYGIYFSDHSYTIFRGTTLASSTDQLEVNVDSDISINTNLLNGNNEIVFISGGLKPTAYGVIHIVFMDTTYEVNINSEGLIETYKL